MLYRHFYLSRRICIACHGARTGRLHIRHFLWDGARRTRDRRDRGRISNTSIHRNAPLQCLEEKMTPRHIRRRRAKMEAQPLLLKTKKRVLERELIVLQSECEPQNTEDTKGGALTAPTVRR